MNAYFGVDASGIVVIQMRAESNGAVGDLVVERGEGESFAGIPYDDFVKAKAGEIAFDADGKGVIKTGEK